MKHYQFAEMKFQNGESMFINAEYITGYAYIREKDETAVAILGDRDPIFFPGDQTKEIIDAFDSIR